MENRDEWDAMLLAPLPGRAARSHAVKPSPLEIESEGADFMNFMGTMTAS